MKRPKCKWEGCNKKVNPASNGSLKKQHEYCSRSCAAKARWQQTGPSIQAKQRLWWKQTYIDSVIDEVNALMGGQQTFSRVEVAKIYAKGRIKGSQIGYKRGRDAAQKQQAA